MSDEPELSIEQLIAEGQDDFKRGDFDACTSKLSEACQKLDELHGELDPASGDAYFLYGRALLESAIERNTVLGDSAQENADAIDKKEIEAKQAVPEANVSVSNPRFHFDDQPTFTSTVAADESDEDDDEDDQQDDFETAWQILDAARIIFEKDDGEAAKLKLADVLLCLGDVSLETEKFNEALPDLKKALEIKSDLLAADDRQLAEIHYKYALALELSDDIPQSLEQMHKVVQVLDGRIRVLEQSSDADNGKGKSVQAPSDEAKKEIQEINHLIPDMKEKIQELETKQESEKEAKEILKSLFGGMLNNDGKVELAKPSNPDAPVNDLSTLVKRKAKDTEPTTGKKPKSS
ncbi:hypothetical protein DM01DRAFT_1380465 [Hesseltinella vesiculosa]|uniref:Tetratricopeptide SHNi-TPR domain-containing protein n=1 Tax=Hesseltinella vesiculosa TaxID=101127 RepID=A0A1X2GU99_9FUNG|nr:hypothetical protein DM01DRAFT_1380465 [Hesseltinella vesiculosa]